MSQANKSIQLIFTKIIPPNIRMKIVADAEKTKHTQDFRNTMYGQNAAIS